jgi:hypothetical protein
MSDGNVVEMPRPAGETRGALTEVLRVGGERLLAQAVEAEVASFIEALIDYPVKFIVPMRFWPPFPFSYPLMGKDAECVTLDDIRRACESFSRQVWQELRISNVMDNQRTASCGE